MHYNKLTEVEKEEYKENHPHIASDLHDGLCQQSVQSDIFSFGRIIGMVNNIPLLQQEKLEELANESMHYHMHFCPRSMTKIIECFSDL